MFGARKGCIRRRALQAAFDARHKASEGLSVNEEHNQHHQDWREPQPDHSDPISCLIFESLFETVP
jgi:hypothetical protein